MIFFMRQLNNLSLIIKVININSTREMILWGLRNFLQDLIVLITKNKEKVVKSHKRNKNIKMTAMILMIFLMIYSQIKNNNRNHIKDNKI